MKGKVSGFSVFFCILNDLSLWGGGHAVSGCVNVCTDTAGFHVALGAVSRFLLQPGLFRAVFEAGLSLLSLSWCFPAVIYYLWYLE